MLPAIGKNPPLVTFTPKDYSALENDLGELLRRVCQDSWLLDYYAGKNDGVQPKDYCAAPPTPQLKPTAK